MTPHAATILERFEALDRLLQSKGFPATSPWWHGTIRRWYESGRRQAVIRAGRRAGKSSTLCRLAVVEGLYGQHAIPPGDVGVVAFISTTRDEANQRLRTVKAVLDALGVKYRPVDGGVELADRAIAFKVYTASVSGVSGFTGVLLVCDEVAKWKDADTGANPATEVLASVRPTMATQPNARIILSSSPMGKWDAHFDAFEQGETEFQITAYAPTWEANPTITEAATHELEPDPSTWEREYKAVPQAEVAESLFTDAELDAATRGDPEVVGREEGVSYAAAIDPGTRGNAWTFVIAALRFVGGIVKRSIVYAQEWRGSTAQPLSPKATLQAMKPVLEGYGIDTVWTDQASGDALRDIAADLGLTLVIEPWTQANKLTAYTNLRTWVRTDQLELSSAEHVKQDLLGVQRKYTRAGVTIDLLKTPDGRHSDYAPAIAIVASKLWTQPVVERPRPKMGSLEWCTEQREARQKAMRDRLERAERRQRVMGGPQLPWGRR
jgi:hypothetical protein